MLIRNHSHSHNTHSSTLLSPIAHDIHCTPSHAIRYFIFHHAYHSKKHCNRSLEKTSSHANTMLHTLIEYANVTHKTNALLLHPIMIYHMEMSDTDPSHHHHKHIYHHQKNHHHEKQITTSHTCCSESQFPISCCFMTYDTITIRWEHNLSKPPNTFAEKLP